MIKILIGRFSDSDQEKIIINLTKHENHYLIKATLAEEEEVDLDEATYTDLMQFSRKVAIAIEKAIPCKRVGVSVIGLEVPHVHVHLIPLNTMEDARFIRKETLTKEDFEATAKAIQSYL